MMCAMLVPPLTGLPLSHPQGTTLLIALRRDSSPGYFPAISELLNFNVLDCSKKFVEQFANGYIVIHITLDESPSELADFLNQVSLMALVPQAVIGPLLLRGQLSTNEMVYAYVVFRFAYVHVHVHARSEAYHTRTYSVDNTSAHSCTRTHARTRTHLHMHTHTMALTCLGHVC